MTSKKIQQTKKNNLILYIGNDVNYLFNIEKEFKAKVTSIKFEYERLFEAEIDKVQALILEVIKKDALVIYIDFSYLTDEYIQLARNLARLNSTIKITLIGLADQKILPKVLEDIYLAGVKVCIVKSTEMFDVIFESMALVFPDKAVENTFAKANLDDPMYIYEPAKVGYITPNSILLECNRPVKSGVMLSVNNWWYQEKLIPSTNFVVSQRFDEGLFYNFQHALELEFLFVDPYIPMDGDDESYIEQMQVEDEEAIDKAMEGLDGWFESNFETSTPKIIKVLVVDKELKVFKSNLRTDSSKYVIRTQPYIIDHLAEIKHLLPQVVFYEVHQNEEEDTDPENNIESLKRLVIASKDIPGYSPYFVVLTSSKEDADKVKADINYEKIICHDHELSLDLVLSLSQILEKKISKNYKIDNTSPSIFLNKSNPISIAELIFNVNLISISESDLIIATDIPISFYTTFRMETPANMFVTIIPSKSTKSNEYYGLIHGIIQSEKMLLRKFINSVFFREKMEDRAKEKEQTAALKIKFKQVEEENHKKAEEDKAAKKASDQAKKDEIAKAREEAKALAGIK
ncbi:MAG: hypothetical protein ACI9QD_000181 [Thermoproteota archaeon]|jgi:hypothetical protein